MVTIYCIEDINDLKYVGSTKQKLNQRLSKHKNGKKRNNYCSSSKLNLDNCKIYSLESCNESNRKERERYYINNINCVNTLKLNYNHNEYQANWRKKNKKEHMKEYYQNNKDEINLFRRRSFVNACYEFIKMLEEY